MKHVLLLVLATSLSAPVYSNTAVNRAAAPSDQESILGSSSNQTVYHDYDNSDTIQTGQSATKREYQYDNKVKACRSTNGTWLRAGDIGYTACMDNSQTMKK